MWVSKRFQLRSDGCMRIVLFLLLSAGALFPQVSPSLLLVNAKVWTVDPSHQEAEAVAIGGNRIIAVGSTEEITRLKGDGTVLIDLEGKRVLPGFNDAHVHFYAGGANLTGPQLRYSKSEAEMRDTLAAYAKGRPREQWITGGNWDHENWTPSHLPTRETIDSVTRDWPVMIKRIDGHMSLANSLALQLAGVDKQTRDVPGGVIVRDADGNPTGVLKDAAQQLVARVIPPPSQQQIIDAIHAAQVYANDQGVTSVQDMSAAPPILRAYQTMLAEDRLRVRIAAQQPLQTWQRQAAIGIQADFGNVTLHIGGLKGFADGSLGSTTALLFQPYLDSPSSSGIPSDELSDPKQMYANIEAADAAGLQVAVHAIGDKANNTILNFYQRAITHNGNRDRRFRIEHAQHLTPADIPRFGQLGVIASMQPYHLMDDGRWAEKRIGPERAKTAYAFRTLLDTGAHVAFGSDWDVAPMSPLMGIYGAVTRTTLDGKHPDGWTPSQKISVAEAVYAYTMGSAYASFDEKVKGSIEPGKLADLVVLKDDIFAIEPAKIADARVHMTIFNGKIIVGSVAHPEYQRLPSGLLLRP